MTESEIIYCDCAYTRLIPEETKRGVLQILTEANLDFQTVPDLCQLAATQDPLLASIATKANLKILACYPRAVRWLFYSAGAPLRHDAGEDVEIFNLRESSVEDVVGRLGVAASETMPSNSVAVSKPAPVPMPDLSTPTKIPPSKTSERESVAVQEIRADLAARKPGHWKPWFPVIDFDRCTNCMQCLSFCLFDVYGVAADGQIEVRNQDKCKADCPACSRVCPEVAIIFPKYRQSPINGAEVRGEDVEREKMKIDVSNLLGGDIYGMLRNRQARARSRFSKERDDERALKERLRCLRELQEKLDIPDSVLGELPTLEAIQEKARRSQSSVTKPQANPTPEKEAE